MSDDDIKPGDRFERNGISPDALPPAMKNWCSQCGRKLTVKWACGPTHALLRLQWKRKQPQRGDGR